MKKLLLAVGLVLGLCAPTLSQSISYPTMTGTQCWSAGQGISGPSAWFCSQLIIDYINANSLNQTSITTKSGTGSATSTATPGTLVWVGTAPTTWTITLPSGPVNGTIVRVTTDTTLTSMVTVQAGSGDTMQASYASQTLSANTTVAWQYVASSKIWYKVQ